MQIKEKNAAKRKVKKYDTKIINSSSPFSAISYLKEQKIDNFVGRKHDLRYLSQVLYDSINNDRSFGIRLSGPGGCGKSTLFGYFIQLIDTHELFQKDYCILKKEECLIIPCFIDAPKGEPASLKYFWVSIIDSLAEEGMDFLEKYTLLLIVKCLEILWKKNFKREELTSILSVIVPNFQENIRLHDISELIVIEKLADVLIAQNEILEKIYQNISQGWRILQRYEISLKMPGSLIQKRNFKFEKRYLDLLFDILSNDIEKCSTAQNILKGLEGEVIKSDSDVIKLFNWVSETWEWIIERPILFLIGIDNIGYLTEHLQDKTSAYIPFIQTILQMRERLKKSLFAFIGTNEDWRLFDNYIREHYDYRSQLRGFLVNNIDLTRLTKKEVLEALSFIMNKFWTEAGIINSSNPLYPFSEDFFAYLYEFYAHEYRDILIFLGRVWLYYKSKMSVSFFQDPLSMIRFVRISMPQYSRKTSSISDITFSNLIEWEKEQIKSKFENIKARHVGGRQSELVETFLEDMLRILQETEQPKQIDWAQARYSIPITLDDGKKTTCVPDVYVRLSPHSIADKKRYFEIQVKMYDEEKYVKKKEIESSLKLLDHAHTDALLFLMTGGGLEDSAINKIHSLDLADRVLYDRPLTDEQFKALTFLMAYEEITGKKPSISLVKETLGILFDQPWDDLLERIRNVGTFKETRISKEIKTKVDATLEGYIAGIATPQASDVQEMEEGQTTEAQMVTTQDQLKQIINKLNLQEKKDLIETVHTRYFTSLADLKFIMDTALNRTDRHVGKVTKDYLKKRVPSHLSDENISELFYRLKNEFQKEKLAKEEFVFTYSGSSIVITDLGRDFSKILFQLNK